MSADDPGLRAAYHALLADYLPRRRWFAGKGRKFTVSHVHPLPWLEGAPAPEDRSRSRIELVTVEFPDGTADTYQVPVAYLSAADDALEHALIGPVEDEELGAVVAYDAVFVKEAVAALYDGFLAADAGASGSSGAELEFRTVEGTELPEPAPLGSVMSAEQSNTSIVYGDDAILKLFRRVSQEPTPTSRSMTR